MRCWYRCTIDCSDAIDWNKFDRLFNRSVIPYDIKDSIKDKTRLVYRMRAKATGIVVSIPASEIVSDQWIKYCSDLSSINIAKKTIRVFSKIGTTTPHVDTHGERACALNWVIGDSSEVMRWFDNIDLPNFTNQAKQQITIDPATLTEIDRCVIDQPTFVRIDQLHDVVPVDQPRFRCCFSVHMSDKPFESWQTTIDRQLSRGTIKDV